MLEDLNETVTLLAKHNRQTIPNYSRSSIENLLNNDLISPNQENGEDGTSSIPSGDSDNSGCICSSIRFFLIEPIILVLIFAYNLSSTVIKNQIIFQTCTAIFDFNETDCALLGGKNISDHIKLIETTVQPYAATIFMTTLLVQSIVPAIFGVFIGAWSDRFGRKPLLIISFIGYATQYILWASIANMNTHTSQSPWYYVIASLPSALLGGNVTYSVAALCFISDVSTSELRTYRMIFYEAAVYIGLMIGSFTSGYIYEAYGAIVIFATSAGAIIFTFLVITLFVPESLQFRQSMSLLNDPNAAANSNNFEEQTTSRRNFNFSLLKEMWSTCFMPRELSDRAILWLAIAALLTTAFVVDGCMTVFYLFIRERFHWTVKQFTTYETFSILAPILGNLVGIFVLRKMLKTSIPVIAILALLSQAVCSFIKGFAVLSWEIYLAVGLGAFKALVNPMCRAVITNLIPTNELGKVLSFQSVLQSLIPFVASPAYTLIYTLTIKTFAGFFNVLSANLFLLAIGFFLVILRKRRAQPERYEAILK